MKTLALKSFLQPRNSPSLTPFTHLSTPLIPQTHYKTNSNASSNALLSQARNGVLVSAVKKQKRGSKKLMELAAFDELDYDDDEDDEEGMDIPLKDMKEWFEKKPSGFGEGKEYDTSLEDKLLEELEQSRKAQIVNINNLKNNPSLGTSNKDKEATKAPEAVPSGTCVRVGNLPKKKNIHRDLKMMFKGFPAIINISPAVLGNKKTRDPICKGFAFIYFGSVEAADRFVQTYSKQSLTFGKIQKQITCEIANPSKSPNLTPSHKYTPGQRLPRIESDLNADFVAVDELSLESAEVTEPADFEEVDGSALESAVVTEPADFEEVDESSLELAEVTEPEKSVVQHQQTTLATSDVIEEGIAHVNLSKENASEEKSDTSEHKTDSTLLKQLEKRRVLKVKKKQTVKRKLDKSPKSNIPGSTKRLKVKEKAVLAGVFSKYGAKG